MISGSFAKSDLQFQETEGCTRDERQLCSQSTREIEKLTLELPALKSALKKSDLFKRQLDG